MCAISSWSPSTSEPRSASRNASGNTASSVRPSTASRGRPSSASIARFQRTRRPSRSSTTMPESRLSRMFSLYSLSPRSSSAFSRRLRYSRPLRIAEAAWAATRLQDVDLLAVERLEAVLAARRRAPRSPRPSRGTGTARRGRSAASSALLGVRRRRGRPAGRRAAVSSRAAARSRGPSPPRATPRARKGAKAPSSPGRKTTISRSAERRADALEQALAGALEVEVGVEVLGEPHQRLARGVALLVREPLEAFLDPRLDRA